MPDSSQVQPVAFNCEGGLVLNRSTFLMEPGQALELQNFEPDIEGGYRRINGFSKYVNAVVPQTSSDATDTDRSWVYNLFPPNHLPGNYGTGSYQSQYIPATHSIDEITGSSWYPYVSQMGIYDIEGDLIAVAKPGQPVQLSSTLSTTFVVRFDV